MPEQVTPALRVVILDDEPLAVQLLAQYVGRHPDLRLAQTFTNPIDGLDYLRTQPADVLLLDVQMPELSGLHVARLLRGEIAVILTTAYEQHALRGYELDVTDYLLKPFSYDRFAQAIAKVRTNRSLPSSIATLPSPAPAAAPAKHIFVKSGNQTRRIELDELCYGTSSGDYLALHLADGSRLLTLENLSDLIGRLPGASFCRIHRSHFVAVARIDFTERRRVVIGSVWLPVSDTYRAALTARLTK